MCRPLTSTAVEPFLTDRLPASITALWFCQFREYEKILLCLGRPFVMPLWMGGAFMVQLAKDWCHVSWRAHAPTEMCARRQTGTADITENNTKEMNQKCLLLDVSVPSGNDFLPRLLSSLSFKHTFFSSLFSLYLTSPVPLVSCTLPSSLSLSLHLPLPISPPQCKVVIPFPLSLLSFTSLS